MDKQAIKEGCRLLVSVGAGFGSTSATAPATLSRARYRRFGVSMGEFWEHLELLYFLV
jgi:hypothetical protein